MTGGKGTARCAAVLCGSSLRLLQSSKSYDIREMTKGREGKTMNMQEASRIILGLRAVGWDDKLYYNRCSICLSACSAYLPDIELFRH